MSAHRCTDHKTVEAARLEVLDAVLDQPLSVARVRHSPAQLLDVDAEADRLRQALAAEGRCERCGGSARRAPLVDR